LLVALLLRGLRGARLLALGLGRGASGLAARGRLLRGLRALLLLARRGVWDWRGGHAEDLAKDSADLVLGGGRGLRG
jgi:hypothetical protein